MGQRDDLYLRKKKKGRDVCWNLQKEAEAALKKAKEKEAAETRWQIMEVGRDKIIVLAQAAQDEAEERSRDELIDLGSEVLYIKGNVLSMVHMLQGTTNPDITVRAQKALDEATEAAGNSCGCLVNLRTRLELLSTDSEAGSFLGSRQTRQRGAREDQATEQE